MSLLITLAADILVAVLLVASIISSVRLSRRITRMKADESALRQTIGDLVVASSTAERAIAGLRATLDECDRTLADRLGTAERYAVDLAAHVEAGESVIGRISAIVSHAQPGRAAEPRSVPGSPQEIRHQEVRHQDIRHQDIRHQEIRSTEPAPDTLFAVRAEPAAKAASASPNGERIGVAAAAALAMSERALGRLRARAA